MKTITIKGIEIGQGIPKVIVPIIGKTKDEIIKKALILNEYKVDVAEWRVDFYEDVFYIEKVLDTIKSLRKTIPNKLIIFTFRTKREGGEKEVSMKEYTAINKAVAESGNVDLIDIEIFSGDNIVMENIRNIHNAGVRVIGSNHDFLKTPDENDLIYIFNKIQNMGADLSKIAVMPRSTKDVIRLLSVTNEMYTKHSDIPIITMSMGTKGVISRISGELFGSAMTYGAVGQGSAPGQVQVEKLITTLDILHESTSENILLEGID